MMDLFENLQLMKENEENMINSKVIIEAKLSKMKDYDEILDEYPVGFDDGTDALIAKGKYFTMMIDGSEEDYIVACILIKRNDVSTCYAFNVYDSKIEAIKEGKKLVKYLDEKHLLKWFEKFNFSVYGDGDYDYEENSNNYDLNNFIWDGKSEVPKKVVNVKIQDGVTEITDNTFNSCKSLKSIKIPNSVTKIGYGAFMYCTSLQSIEIPNSVTEIGRCAFMYCESLQSIKIPNSVIEIGQFAFVKSGLSSIEIPNPNANVSFQAFLNTPWIHPIKIGGVDKTEEYSL